MSSRPSIDEWYPGLSKIPWVPLGESPSRVHRLKKFSKETGVPNLFIKRDDCFNSIYGGNKVRKYEYILGEAKTKNRKTLITVGSVGSNQVLATGIFGKQLGFDVVGVLMDQPNSLVIRPNLLADFYYEVDTTYTQNMVTTVGKTILKYIQAFILGRKPYFIMSGASSKPGNVGFVNAVFELKKQLDAGLIPEPDYIICPGASLGTAAGLYLGCKLLEMKTKVLPINVSIYDETKYAKHINDTCKFLKGFDQRFHPSNVQGMT